MLGRRSGQRHEAGSLGDEDWIGEEAISLQVSTAPSRRSREALARRSSRRRSQVDPAGHDLTTFLPAAAGRAGRSGLRLRTVPGLFAWRCTTVPMPQRTTARPGLRWPRPNDAVMTRRRSTMQTPRRATSRCPKVRDRSAGYSHQRIDGSTMTTNRVGNGRVVMSLSLDDLVNRQPGVSWSADRSRSTACTSTRTCHRKDSLDLHCVANPQHLVVAGDDVRRWSRDLRLRRRDRRPVHTGHRPRFARSGAT